MWDFLIADPARASSIAAICGVFVALLSILLTCVALSLQRTHNYKSVMPIAHISVGDYEDRLVVQLCNNGIGPLVVTKLTVSNGTEEKKGIISWMPEPPLGILWSTFTPSLDGRAMLPGHKQALIELTGDMHNKRFAEFRDRVREVMSKLVVSVEYNDIYGRPMPPKRHDLEWFGRHFDTADDQAS